MRPLTPDESKAVFEKLIKYIGDNVTHLVEVKLPRCIGQSMSL